MEIWQVNAGEIELERAKERGRDRKFFYIIDFSCHLPLAYVMLLLLLLLLGCCCFFSFGGRYGKNKTEKEVIKKTLLFAHVHSQSYKQRSQNKMKFALQV